MQGMIFKFSFLLILGIMIPLNASAQQYNADTLKITVADTTAFKDSIVKNPKQVDEIISYAKKFLGTPYQWAGTTPSGFDCSGFIYYVMGSFGLSLSRTAGGLAEFGRTVKLSELRPGDLMFFKGRSTSSSSIGHVGMVVEVRPDAIMFIHSSSSRGVVIDNFKTSSYYIPRFIKAKRLDYGEVDQK
jgi:cell wall-associated NlpC family hydrolase